MLFILILKDKLFIIKINNKKNRTKADTGGLV